MIKLFTILEGTDRYSQFFITLVEFKQTQQFAVSNEISKNKFHQQ